MADPLKDKVLSGLVWRGLERFGTQAIQFAISIILARLLAPSDFGTVAIIMVFIALADVFVDSGFGAALIQKKDADARDFNHVDAGVVRHSTHRPHGDGCGGAGRRERRTRTSGPAAGWAAGASRALAVARSGLEATDGGRPPAVVVVLDWRACANAAPSARDEPAAKDWRLASCSSHERGRSRRCVG